MSTLKNLVIRSLNDKLDYPSPTKEIHFESKNGYRHSQQISFDRCDLCENENTLVLYIPSPMHSPHSTMSSDLCLKCIQRMMTEAEFTPKEKMEYCKMKYDENENELVRIQTEENQLKRKRKEYKKVMKTIDMC